VGSTPAVAREALARLVAERIQNSGLRSSNVDATKQGSVCWFRTVCLERLVLERARNHVTPQRGPRDIRALLIHKSGPLGTNDVFKAHEFRIIE
jgi:hypothetical protein